MKLTFLKNKSLKFKLGLVVAALIFLAVIVRVAFHNPENVETSDEIPKVTSVYTNQEFGYKFEYPAWWTYKKSPNGLVDVIMDKTGQAVVVIEAKKASGDENNVLLESGAAEEILKKNSGYQLKSFKRVEYKGVPAFFADGVFNDGSKVWNFQKYELFSPKGTRYSVQVFVERSLAQYYDKNIAEILSSFTMD